MNDTIYYRWRLGKLVTVCPKCGRREFKPYVDCDGNMLSPEAGRCNREIKCGYHLRPYEFAQRQGLHLLPGNRFESGHRPRVVDLVPSFIDSKMVEYSLKRQGNLYQWFCSRFKPAVVNRIFDIYLVGYSPKLSRTMFWQVDDLNRVRSAKLIAYRPDGHRDKEAQPPATFAHSLLARKYPQYDEFNYVGCYFGANLTSQFAFKYSKLLIVESEKTAMYLAMELLSRHALGRYLPIATGGSSGLSVDQAVAYDPCYRLAPLIGRNVILLPDVDATDKWRGCVNRLNDYCSSVRFIDLRKCASGPTDDILDILERRKHPATA